MSLLNLKLGEKLSRDQMKRIGGGVDAVLYCSGPAVNQLVLYGTGCNDLTSGEDLAICQSYDALYTNAMCTAGPPP